MSATQRPQDVDPRDTTLGLQLGVTTAIHITALTITGLRVYTRVFLVKAFGVDDGFMIGATVCSPM